MNNDISFAVESNEAIRFLENFRKTNVRDLTDAGYLILYRTANRLSDKLRRELTGKA